MQINDFKKEIWRHYRAHGRSLPWRQIRDPYKILVSEVMLQQTQVSRVVTYYKKFTAKFPTIRALARAPVNQVLLEWQGLGYNRRALNLKRLAEVVMQKYGGKIPRSREELEALPAVGPATAGGVLAFAFNIPTVFIETNIRRVFIHFFFPRKKKVSDKEILPLVGKTLPTFRLTQGKTPRTFPTSRTIAQWYWALYDYGAMLAKRVENPNRRAARYQRQPKFEGSDRQLRGGILKFLLEHPHATDAELLKLVASKTKLAQIVDELEKEGFFSLS